MDTVKSRLLHFLSTIPNRKGGIGMTKGEFQTKVGLKAGAIANMGRSLHPDTVTKIKSHYPELNEIWLLHGQGDMRLPGVPKVAIPAAADAQKGVTKALELSILNLTESNRQLAEAFVKQADAQIVQAQANKLLAETNNGTMHRLTNSTDEKGSRLSFSYPSFPLLERMAQAGVPEQWDSVEKGLEILGRLMTQDVKDVQDKQR